MRIGFGFFAGSREKSVFDASYLSNSNIPNFESIFTEGKVNNFLSILSTDYKQFRTLDEQMNNDLDPVFTKNRFNPLFISPFIKEELNSKTIYIMPSTTAFVHKILGGIFWWFNNYFEENSGDAKLHLEYRKYFGEIFEKYVGLILKDIYGDRNTFSEIAYSKMNKKFIDWHVEKGNKCYLFEAKANQFSLLSRRTGDIGLLINNELKKVTESIVETFKNVRDIEIYDELKKFRDKEIIPIIVFLEIPLVSTGIYKEKIDKLLLEIETKDNLVGLKDFKYYLLNIEELELYSEVKDLVEIENVFEDIKGDMNQGLTSYMTKINNGDKLKNKFLDKIYESFWSGYLDKKYK
jgi:hypothetical protein